MVTLLTILVVAGMLATLGVMLAGMIGLSATRADPMRSNRLMRYRVILQGVTLLLFVLLMAARHG